MTRGSIAATRTRLSLRWTIAKWNSDRIAWALSLCGVLSGAGCDKVVHIGSEPLTVGGAGGVPNVAESPAPGAGGQGGVQGDLDGGATGPATAPIVDLAPSDAGAIPVDTEVGDVPDDCAGVTGQSRLWSFDTDREDWELVGGEADLSWTANAGFPDFGALEINGLPPTNDDIYVRAPSEPLDLRGKTVTANVFVESGTNVSLKVYAQSGDNFGWANGEIRWLTPGEWLCLALNADDPAYTADGFDPANVRRVGVTIFGESAVRIYVDEFAY